MYRFHSLNFKRRTQFKCVMFFLGERKATRHAGRDLSSQRRLQWQRRVHAHTQEGRKQQTGKNQLWFGS